MIFVGQLAAAAALGLGLIALLLGAAAFARRRQDLLASARNAVIACAGFTTLAAAGVIYAILVGDYQLEFVASHSDRSLPLLYKIGALWGGMSGSLLFWAWLLGLFSTAAVLRHRSERAELMGPVISTLMAVEVFFLGVVVFFSSPWKRAAFVPPDGQGLNPLLQHPAMVIHPPCLYLGFVGFTLPFAFAIAALVSGRTGDEWLKKSRLWAILAWMFLAAGNVLGARWAYTQLGWGGYWAWDPVENAAFMPWLAGTAFIHSSMIQERKGMLKIWNMLLAVVTFLLTIFGTFITRSGLVASVHSFARSDIGYLFAGFLVVVTTASGGLLFARRHLLRSERSLESFLSRESSFLLNNLILLGGAVAILWGTIFPMVSEAAEGVRVSVGPPFFNRIMIPIGLGLLALMGIGPLIAWRRSTVVQLRRMLTIPVVLGIIAVAVLIVFGISHAYALVTFSLCAFVLAGIAGEFVRGIRARRELGGRSIPVAFCQLFRRAPRRFGGYIVHAGVVLVFIGFAGAAFTRDGSGTLARGESMRFHGYEILFNGLRTYGTAAQVSVGADLSVMRGGRPVAHLLPRKSFFLKSSQMVSRVAIQSTLGRDLYLILTDYDLDAQKAGIKAYVNPLVAWFWLGGIVMVLGGLLALIPAQRQGAALLLAGGLIAGSVLFGPGSARAQEVGTPPASVAASSGSATTGLIAPAASVEEVARKLMDPCPDCRGRQLSACDCGPARQAKEEIGAMLAAGKTEQEVLDSFVDRYGTWILAEPMRRGFNLLAYLLPVGLITAAGGFVAVFLRRSVHRADLPAVNRSGEAAHAGGTREMTLLPSLSPSDRSRLEREIRGVDPRGPDHGCERPGR